MAKNVALKDAGKTKGSAPAIKEILHRNAWGQWTFFLCGENLCGLKFKSAGNSLANNKIAPSSLQACAYASPDTGAQLRGKAAQTYKKAVAQLSEYLAGKRKEFDLPYEIYGTDFQTAVWTAVREIPYGETRSYKQIADSIGHAGAERAVGNALHQNPLQVIIPCHRVISNRGKLSGYALGTDIKRRLLCMEGAIQNELELE